MVSAAEPALPAEVDVRSGAASRSTVAASRRGAETLAVPRDTVIIACDVITRQGDALGVEFAMSEGRGHWLSRVDRIISARCALAPRHEGLASSGQLVRVSGRCARVSSSAGV